MGNGPERGAILGLILGLLAPFLSVAVANAAECSADKIQMRGDWGRAFFNVELAQTDEEHGQGLMFRETLQPRSGMLFLFETPRNAQFWMKNTLIPLDMIFIAPTGIVKHIHHEATPGDLTPIKGGPGIVAVLELAGGTARRFGVNVGSHIRHPYFSNENAVWPC